MADQFDIITATVPTSTGTQSYTSSKITDWKAAIFIMSGNVSDASDGARYCISFVCDDGSTQGDMFICGRGKEGLTVNQTRQLAFEGNTTAIAHLDDGAPNSFPYVEAEYSASLSNGVTINWSNVEASKGFRLIVILMGGLTNVFIGSSGTNSIGYRPSMVFTQSSGASLNSGGAADASFHVGIGAAIDDGTPTQESYCLVWPAGADPTTAHGLSRSDRYACDLTITPAEEGRAVDAFSATGWTELAPVGSPVRTFMAIEFSDEDRVGAVAFEALDGTTGDKSFTGLGIPPEFVLGIVSGVTAQDTVQGSLASLSTMCVFATNGTTTASVTCSYKHGQSLGPGLTEARSAYSSTDITMLTHDGGSPGIAFQAAPTLTGTGLDLNVTTGFTGSMLLIAVSRTEILEALDDDVEVSEVVGRMVGKLAEDATVEISEEVASVLFEHVFVDDTQDGVTRDSIGLASSGAQEHDVGQGGAEAISEA